MIKIILLVAAALFRMNTIRVINKLENQVKSIVLTTRVLDRLT